MLGEGDTLTEVTKDWLKALPEGKGLESSDSFTLLQDAEGNQYLYGNCYRDERALPHICGRKRAAVRWILHHRSGWSLWIWMAIGSMIRRSM